MKKRSRNESTRELCNRVANVKASKKPLPLVHVTTVGKAREILASRQLETSECKFFKKSLLYFFVYRAAYKLKNGRDKSDQINRFPFVFVLQPTAVSNPYHIYPFDTGAALSGQFDLVEDPEIPLDDYELVPNYEVVNQFIEWAFGSVSGYLKGELRNGVAEGVPAFETTTHGYIKIAEFARSGHNRPDARASAIEVATDRHVRLLGNVQLVIFPKQYLEDSGETNAQLLSELREQGILFQVYDWQPNSSPDEFYQDIENIVSEHVKVCT